MFNSKVVTTEVQAAYNWLEKEMNLLNSAPLKSDVLSNENADSELDVSSSESEAKMYDDDVNGPIVNGNKSPFDAHFKEVIDGVKNESTGQTKNPLYNPDALDILKSKWLPIVSFWTSLLLG